MMPLISCYLESIILWQDLFAFDMFGFEYFVRYASAWCWKGVEMKTTKILRHTTWLFISKQQKESEKKKNSNATKWWQQNRGHKCAYISNILSARNETKRNTMNRFWSIKKWKCYWTIRVRVHFNTWHWIDQGNFVQVPNTYGQTMNVFYFGVGSVSIRLVRALRPTYNYFIRFNFLAGLKRVVLIMFYFLHFGNEGKMNVLWVVSMLLLVVKNIPTFSIDKFIAFAFCNG